MRKRSGNGAAAPARRMKPALSPEARENQLISLAVDLAEKQLIEGTASAQVITHYLKLATVKEQLEREGWKVIVIWECELKKEFEKTMERIILQIKAPTDSVLSSYNQKPAVDLQKPNC